VPTTSTTVLQTSDVLAAAAWHFDALHRSLRERILLAADLLVRGVVRPPQLNVVLQPLDRKLLHDGIASGRYRAVLLDRPGSAIRAPVLLELRASAQNDRWIVAVAAVDPDDLPATIERVWRGGLLPAPLWPFGEVDEDTLRAHAHDPVLVGDEELEDE
jgi:hypothetical protein